MIRDGPITEHEIRALEPDSPGRCRLLIIRRKDRYMAPEIVVALLSMCGTAFGSIVGVMTANKLTTYRIEQLEKKVEQHNHLSERMVVVEQSTKSAHHRIDEIVREEETHEH